MRFGKTVAQVQAAKRALDAGRGVWWATTDKAATAAMLKRHGLNCRPCDGPFVQVFATRTPPQEDGQ